MVGEIIPESRATSGGISSGLVIPQYPTRYGGWGMSGVKMLEPHWDEATALEAYRVERAQGGGVDVGLSGAADRS
jgi:hypothetical protein